MGSIKSFNEQNFTSLCDKLAKKDTGLAAIINQYGHPPMWKRPATFETLIHIILEQQVSLASALAALNKLKQRLPEITPQSFLSLSNEDLKACYFSRQKIIYTQHLATELFSGQLILDKLTLMDNDEVRTTLTKIKGIGNWSVDIYLMMVLQRCDLFPLGDVALMTSVRETKNLPKETTKDEIAAIAGKWKPYQTIAAFILWHGYLSRRKR